jgi:histone H3/H4
MADIPNAPVKRLIIEGSQGCRISGTAVELAAGHISNILKLVGRAAGQAATADGRKTIQDQDINKAWSALTVQTPSQPA